MFHSNIWTKFKMAKANLFTNYFPFPLFFAQPFHLSQDPRQPAFLCRYNILQKWSSILLHWHQNILKTQILLVFVKHKEHQHLKGEKNTHHHYQMNRASSLNTSQAKTFCFVLFFFSLFITKPEERTEKGPKDTIFTYAVLHKDV